MSEKSCFKCLKKLPLESFYKHSQMGDGRLNKCISCTKKDVAEHRQNNLEKIRAYDKMRASMPHRMALNKRVLKDYRQKFPERYAATSAVNSALRTGKLIRYPCEICGEKKSVGHHPDYSRPLDVIWLCQAHHKQLHAECEKF